MFVKYKKKNNKERKIWFKNVWPFSVNKLIDRKLN